MEHIISKIAFISKKYNLKTVYLFGSYARGEATDNSDIDILIDTDGSEVTSLFSLGALYEDLSVLLDETIDIMTVNSLNAQSQDPTFSIICNNIRRDMVKIYERA